MGRIRILKVLFWVQAGVNLVGAFGPEISFDALWYHLPLSRLLLERGWWGIVPGGLLYYSGMPRLMDWFNAGLLGIGQSVGLESPELLPKLLSYMSGVAAGVMIVKLGSKYFSEQVGWVAAVLWYTTILVGWQSVVVYVDLARTLLIFLAVWQFTERRWGRAGVVMGLAYSVKMLSGIEAGLMVIVALWRGTKLKSVGRYIGGFLPFVLFWGVVNLMQGYEFLYPFGQNELYLVDKHWGWSWQHIVGPMSGDGRYLLPEYAGFLLIMIAMVWQGERSGGRRKLIIGVAVAHALIGIGYRAVANTKFVPYLIGKETKREFLSNHLNFEFADWYDTDGWVEENLKDERYLVRGVHNTYYLPGSKWEHESWVQGEECFPYVLVQGDPSAHSVKSWQGGELVYENRETGTKIFQIDCGY